MKPRIYDKSMNLIGVLQNATEVGYRHKFNDLYTAKFKLPVSDPKNSLCETYNIVDIFDGDESKGKYRILEEPESDVTSDSTFIEYSLEHVITFLINDVIDGYLELGGYNFRTRAVLEYILNKQTVKRWQLGTCDFDRQFQYSWENTSLMDALFSVPTCFDEDYHWEYDTSSYPWTIHLKRTSTDRSCEIRRKRNMKFIKRHIDGSKLCTRLYCKGYGEGVNQLTVAEVNNGLPYIQDAAAVAKYGILSSHWIDRRFTHAETLYARGLAILNELKNPAISYTASAVDLSKVTGQEWDKFDEGKYVHMIDEERNIDVDAMIIETGKDDVDGRPLEMSITICNKSSDVSSDLEDIARRASITSQYSQGATNLYCEQFADNADGTHPAKMRIYIPDSCSKINQVLLSWRCSPFRAYSTSAAAGGSTTVTSAGGGSSTVTSGGGGGTTVTSGGGGGTTVTTETKTFTPSGDSGNTGVPVGSSYTDYEGGDNYTSYAGSHSHTVDSHSHSLNSHTHSFSDTYSLSWGHQHTTGSSFVAGNNTGGVYNYAAKSIEISGTTGQSSGSTGTKSPGTDEQGSHRHTYNTYHRHEFAHYHKLVSITIPALNVTIPSHTHSVTISSHTHSVSISDHTHSVTLQDHTHGIVYGIYEGTTAQSCTIKVDNTDAVTNVTSGNDIDIIPYLSKDSEGKITRGTWHEIEIVPDRMTRIEADLFVKTFVTSYTGGNY